ncbi:hypothetical protein CEXT_86681 [Caerostris extrusa]|uniref:Uncharacterized protein n=1 Tax=Caerostris extrusa TaxID=172846 RepID=A0AAV4XD62_CAEEX|nr:hypothetical protein CEXT_86681 [Caerostris extrusa]
MEFNDYRSDSDRTHRRCILFLAGCPLRTGPFSVYKRLECGPWKGVRKRERLVIVSTPRARRYICLPERSKVPCSECNGSAIFKDNCFSDKRSVFLLGPLSRDL